MQQETPAILGYEHPHAKRGRRSMAAGFIGGWLLGVPISGVSIASFLGGSGIVVPMICVSTAIAGLPAFGLMWVFSRSGLVGNLAAFAVALISSVAVSFGFLALFISSFQGC